MGVALLVALSHLVVKPCFVEVLHTVLLKKRKGYPRPCSLHKETCVGHDPLPQGRNCHVILRGTYVRDVDQLFSVPTKDGLVMGMCMILYMCGRVGQVLDMIER